MNTFSETVEKCCRFISEKKMLKAGDCVVAGVSGGADSVFLFHVLVEMAGRLDLRLVVAHLNHGLRPEAEEELVFVREMCRKHKVQFHSGVVSSGVLAGTAGLSIEMAARERRKRFLDAVAEAHGDGKIALGHTQSDHVETMLMNIHRGAGLRGLTGIHPVRGRTIRPLLFLKGGEIRTILVENGIQFLEDSSNTDPKFLRNRVRSKILPSINEVFGPKSGGKWHQLSVNAADSLSAMKELLAHFLATKIQQDDCGFRVERELFQQLSEPLLKEIFLFLLEKIAGSTYFMTARRLNQLVVFAAGSGYGEVTVHPGMGVQVIRSGRWLYFLTRMPGVNLEIRQPGIYKSWFQERFLFSMENTETELMNDASMLFLDEKLFPFPFRLGPVDFHKDKVKHQGRVVRDVRRFLKKRGLGKLERERMSVLKHGSRILWVPGFTKIVSEVEKGTEGSRITVYFTVDMR
ncbi:MAG: tRNA lysidine(34) synthetase TilS [Acidobacteria bacterium]|nr:tRNA lysidine(34) synthetase TilS [Acidobacteriota bacterium]